VHNQASAPHLGVVSYAVEGQAPLRQTHHVEPGAQQLSAAVACSGFCSSQVLSRAPWPSLIKLQKRILFVKLLAVVGGAYDLQPRPPIEVSSHACTADAKATRGPARLPIW